MAEENQAELSSIENESGEVQSELESKEQGQEAEHIEEEFEIVLGSVEQPSTEQEKAPKKPRSVKRLLNERRENKDRISELERENAQLRGGAQTNTQANAPAMPVMPTQESTGYDSAAYQLAMTKYNSEMAAYNTNNATQAAEAVYDRLQNGTQKSAEAERVNGVIAAHYDRADKLNLPDYGDAEAKVIEILDQNAVSQIAQIVPNSEAVVYYLGKNPDKAFEIRQIWEQNPGAAAFKLGELSKDLKIVPKQRKQRPSPESKVSGAAPASKSSLERDIEKERQRIHNGETNDLSELQRLKGQLRRASA